jgi:hypothetical protein
MSDTDPQFWCGSLLYSTKTSVAVPDPGFGIRCLFDHWILDPGWVKSLDPEWSGRNNNHDHISESLETIFSGLKYLILWCGSGNRDGKNSNPGWKNSDPESRMEKFGSWIRDEKNSDPGPGMEKVGSLIRDGKIRILDGKIRSRHPG